MWGLGGGGLLVHTDSSDRRTENTDTLIAVAVRRGGLGALARSHLAVCYTDSDSAAGVLPEGNENMFSVGQRVWHRDGRRGGTVLECDGDRVFLVQDNGAELDFRAGDLTATPPPDAKAQGASPRDGGDAARSAGYVMPNRVLRSGDIMPEHMRVLGIVPVRTLQAVVSVFERRPGAGKFSALDVAGKLNAIVEITAVPYRTMREYSDRPGELGLMMGKGLADSRKNG